MLHLDQFDIKTGKPIQVDINGQAQSVLKQVEHSYLEHWLTTNGINAQFSVARFYETVNDADRLRLESEGKYLAYAHGSDGYFTNRATAQLMALGSDTVSPIYTGDRNSPHNMVAYGGLISSDGVASTTIQSARILVVNDEQRTHGDAALLGRNGQPIPEPELKPLLDKMGDGTMLVTTRTMQALQTPEEIEKIAIKSAEKAGLSDDLSLLAQEISQLEKAVDETATITQQQGPKLARRSVYQFRATSPDLPGIAKGTMASSYWCDRLGVDAIISVNSIKGSDQRLLSPGIKEVSNFWVNRKTQAQYGRQSVGPQVEYTIPDATRDEFKPRIQKKAEKLAQVVGDFDALSQYYVEQKEHVRTQRPDWAAEVLTADKYGQGSAF